MVRVRASQTRIRATKKRPSERGVHLSYTVGVGGPGSQLDCAQHRGGTPMSILKRFKAPQARQGDTDRRAIY